MSHHLVCFFLFGAGVMDPEDTFADRIADALAAGKGLYDPEVIALVVREGGHSHARIVHAMGDAIGREGMRAVIGQVFADPAGWTLQDMLTVGRLMITAAVRRLSRSGGQFHDCWLEFDNIENIKRTVEDRAGVAILPEPTLAPRGQGRDAGGCAVQRASTSGLPMRRATPNTDRG